MAGSDDVTELLLRASEGDRESIDRLLPLVYDELRRLAEHQLHSERRDHTLQATALVHEAYMSLVDQTRVQWKNRAHFFAVAAQAIRRILVDHARSKQRAKRGGGWKRVDLDDQSSAAAEPSDDLVSLDSALTAFADEHPDQARVVEMRFFGGLTADETARVLGVSTRTVERRWQYARAWLHRALEDPAEANGGLPDG